MNGENLLKAMSQVDERFIQEAETEKLSKPKHLWVRWAAATAACLAVVLAVAFVLDPNPEQLTQNGSPLEMATLPAGFWEDLVLQAPEADMAPDCAETVAEHNEPVRAPADAIVEEPAMDQEPGEPKEVPSILLRIDTWQENGFTATVEEILDTNIYPVGTKLTVEFRKNIRIVETDGEVVSCTIRTPTKEDFPAGSVVQVLFAVRDDGVLLVEQIGKEDAF